MLPEQLQLFAAFMSAIAALAAAVATWRGPISAAKMAERLRRESEGAQEERRFKLNVFAMLMQERAEIYSYDAVKALNSVDIAFSKSAAVREAWAELYQALNTSPIAPGHVLDERIRKLLREMATDLGISDGLRLDDFWRVYYPTALAQEREVQSLERQAALKRLTSNVSPAENVSASQHEEWPPRPA